MMLTRAFLGAVEMQANARTFTEKPGAACE